ncbi:MAG: S8 family serine peptidase [Kiritimatiellia bacterium]
MMILNENMICGKLAGLIFSSALFISAISLYGQPMPAEYLAGKGVLHHPADRASVVAEIRDFEIRRRNNAHQEARAAGLPIRGQRKDGHIFELVDIIDGVPLYHTTLNANAAISTGADILRMSPYNADGNGWTAGIWDGGSVRSTHQEFSGRVNVMDGAAPVDHATHVGGTVGAAGVVSSAKGMMPSVAIDSYDWNSDLSEMTSRGASYPDEAGKIYISNHSYGYYTGWVYNGGSPKWVWYGSGQDESAVETNFGRYAAETGDVDALAYSLPYYLIFWAAGNDRNENPVNGDEVSLSAGGEVVSYDSTSHPPGDGVYKNGYDTVSFTALAKNVMSVGAVADAVSGGLREPDMAVMASFSSYGASDDGRIKPDLVANGNELYSSVSISDTEYRYYSGTSMASPNAAGTAGQIVQWYDTLFPGQAMRSSSLKALLIHTADDLGNTGPDYRFGWGLLNGADAVQLLQDYHDHPGTYGLIEDRLTDTRTSVEYPFTWDGVSPIRATLCWTDPAGTVTSSHDSRDPCLVNNLDLRITAPDGTTVYEPWVMPFVGDWSDASLAYAAVKGSNTTDNVEQVAVASPGQVGTYSVVVSYAGSLSGGAQNFSLVLSGVSSGNIARAPLLTDSTPLTASGETLFTLTGDYFMPGAAVRLLRTGETPAAGSHTLFEGDRLQTRINTDALAAGWWNMEVTNPDGQIARLYNAFAVPGQLWIEDFETNNIIAKGWSLTTDEGVNQWVLTSDRSVSPTQSMFFVGSESRSDTCLVSPPVAVSSNALDAAAQISFMHDFSFESDDGAVLELSLDGIEWYDVGSAESGATFLQNGYKATIGGNTGSLGSRNPIGGQQGWSGSSGGFIKTVIELTDKEMYSGHSVQLRWRIGTDAETASTGWYVDDVSLSGISEPPPVPHHGTVIFMY